MNPIPRPRTEDERVFVSGYRYDSIRSFLIHYLIPLCGLIALVGIPWFSWGLFRSIEGDMPTQAQRQLVVFIGMMASLGVLMGLSFFFLAAYLKRRIFDTYIVLNDREIIYRTGPKEIHKPLSEWKDFKIRHVGRIQTATLVFEKGRITFDASMVDHNGPRPVIRRSLKGEYFRWVNLTTQPIKILENDLYGVLKRRFDRLAAAKNPPAST